MTGRCLGPAQGREPKWRRGLVRSLWARLPLVVVVRLALQAGWLVVCGLRSMGGCRRVSSRNRRHHGLWQRAVSDELVEGFDEVVVEFVDEGRSRWRSWWARPAAAALLAAAERSDREFDAAVVGEYERGFEGDQFRHVLGRLTALGVQVWLPEAGGPAELERPVRQALMVLLGAQVHREVARARQRVVAAMRVPRSVVDVHTLTGTNGQKSSSGRRRGRPPGDPAEQVKTQARSLFRRFQPLAEWVREGTAGRSASPLARPSSTGRDPGRRRDRRSSRRPAQLLGHRLRQLRIVPHDPSGSPSGPAANPSRAS